MRELSEWKKIFEAMEEERNEEGQENGEEGM